MIYYSVKGGSETSAMGDDSLYDTGFKSELIIRSLLHAFVASLNVFLKRFDAESLDNM